MSIKLLNTIISKTAKEFEVTPADVKSQSRSTAAAALARQVAMYVYMFVERCFQCEVAERFNRDPSTVTYAMKKVTKLIKTNKTFRERVERLCKAA